VSNSATNHITMCNGCSSNGGTGGGAAVVKSEMNWLATFRGRAGITVGNAGATLLYITGGLALGGIKNQWGAGYNAGAARARVSDDQFVADDVRLGWVVGAGFEHKMRSLPGWSFKGEALWVDFENKTVSNPGPSAFTGVSQTFNTQFQNQAMIGRVGLNYAFH